MPGVVNGIAFGKGFDGQVHQAEGIGGVGGQLKKMEAAKNRVRHTAQMPFCRSQYIHNAFVCAACQQYGLASGFQNQMLFMGKDVGLEFAADLLLKLRRGGSVGRVVRHVGEQKELAVQPEGIVGEHGAFMKEIRRSAQTDILGFLARQYCIVGLEGFPPQIELGLAVHAAEGFQSAAVVRMAVGQHCRIYRRQVHAQRRRVPQKFRAGSHVKQHLVTRRFPVQRQSSGSVQAFTGRVLYQCDNFHIHSPFFRFSAVIAKILNLSYQNDYNISVNKRK